MKTIGIDLAGCPTNPSGFALLSNHTFKTRLVHSNKQIVDLCVQERPALVAIDAPLSLPKCGAIRKAEREMRRRGYHVLPPLFPAMKELTLRGIRLTEKLRKKQIKVIEIHPTSTRKALRMPLKDWRRIQEIFRKMGWSGEWRKRPLTPHEIDAITATITAWLHIKGETERIGGRKEGYIVVPIPKHWKRRFWIRA